MPAYRDAASGSGLATSVVVGKPATTTNGDLLIASICFYNGGDSGRDVNSVPSGWTLVQDINLFSTGRTTRTKTYWKVAASEPSTWSFGLTASAQHVWGAIAVSSPVSPYIADKSVQASTGSGLTPTTWTALSVNASSGSDMLVAIFSGRSGIFSAGITPPSGYTERLDVYETSGNCCVELSTKAASGASGATGNVNASYPTGTSEITAAQLIALVGTAFVPVAGFTGTPLSGTEPLAVTFTDTSTNGPTSWAWDFGDGGTSSSQNPTHTYTTGGTFTVALTATNSAGSNTLTRTGYVVVSDQPRPIRINTSQGLAEISNASSFVSGAGAPTVAAGATGAIYLDTGSGRMYGPKAAGAWPGTALGGLTGASGATASRPASVPVGYGYWDTTLGKPVWWNGTVWKDATGTTV